MALRPLILVALVVLGAWCPVAAQEPGAAASPGGPRPLDAVWHDHQLANGTLLSVVHAPEQADQALFLVLPTGLVLDGDGELQWSHLAEHVLVRTVDPDRDLATSAGLRVSAETTQHTLRLEAYAPPARWTEALDLLETWLGLRQVPPALLTREKALVTEELRVTIPPGHTHKWAAAAWNQVVRHGSDHVRLFGALGELSADAFEAGLAERLQLGPGVRLLAVGPVPPDEVLARVAATLGVMGDGLPYAVPPAADPSATRAPAHREATWDVPGRHYLEYFLLPDEGPTERAAADALELLIKKRLAQTPSLEQRGFVISAAVDHLTPEGRWFVLSSPLPEGESVETLRQVFRELLVGVQDAAETPHVIAQMRGELARWPDFDTLRAANAGHPWLVDLEARQAVFLLYAQINTGLALPDLQAAYERVDPEAVAKLARRLFREPNRASLLLEQVD